MQVTAHAWLSHYSSQATKMPPITCAPRMTYFARRHIGLTSEVVPCGGVNARARRRTRLKSYRVETRTEPWIRVPQECTQRLDDLWRLVSHVWVQCCQLLSHVFCTFIFRPTVFLRTSSLFLTVAAWLTLHSALWTHPLLTVTAYSRQAAVTALLASISDSLQECSGILFGVCCVHWRRNCLL